MLLPTEEQVPVLQMQFVLVLLLLIQDVPPGVNAMDRSGFDLI